MKSIFVKLCCLSLLASGCARTLSAQTYHAPVGGVRIAWDHESLKKISADNFRSAGYARMIQLKGKYRPYVCIYEADGNTVVTTSGNRGMTWSTPVIVAARQNGVAMAVPDILQLQDGSLLAMYNPRPRGNDTTQHFEIKTKKSTDGGVTWTDERTLYQAGSKFGNGCWEPSAIQMPDGEIQLFFANEGPFTRSNEQNISMVRSKDGGLTWSSEIAVSFRKGSRDGMPSPLLLKNGRDIVFAIEDNGFKNFKPYIIRSSVENNWSTMVDANSADREYALADRIPDSIYAGAPYLRQLNYSGEIVLSYQGTEGRINNMDHSEMKVVIGDPDARNFTRKSVPFKLRPDRSGLWNSLCVTNDGSVIALTSTNNYSANRRGEVWMVEGHIMNELSAKKTVLKAPLSTSRETSYPHNIFITNKAPYALNGTAVYNDEYFYIEAELDVDSLSNAPKAFKAGMEFYIDPQNKSYDMPGKGIYKLTIGAKGGMTVYEGDKGKWEKKTQTIKVTRSKDQFGYAIGIYIPWKFLGGRPQPNTRMGFNMSLVVPPTGDISGYTESICGNDAEKPFTWCTLKLY